MTSLLERCLHVNEKLVMVDDTGTNGHEGQDYAYNVWWCPDCHTLTKQDVWTNSGRIEITIDGEIRKLK